MSIIDVELVGGPFDGTFEAKDVAGKDWLMLPVGGRKQSLYIRPSDGDDYYFKGIFKNSDDAISFVQKEGGFV